jgi:hypothetical protein
MEALFFEKSFLNLELTFPFPILAWALRLLRWGVPGWLNIEDLLLGTLRVEIAEVGDFPYVNIVSRSKV